MYDLMNFGKFGYIHLEVHKPEVREMVICFFMKVPEVECQVHDKYTKFTQDHVFHELPFAGVS